MPARIPDTPAPICITFRGLASSAERSEISGTSDAVAATIFLRQAAQNQLDLGRWMADNGNSDAVKRSFRILQNRIGTSSQWSDEERCIGVL